MKIVDRKGCAMKKKTDFGNLYFIYGESLKSIIGLKAAKAAAKEYMDIIIASSMVGPLKAQKE